MAAGNDSPITTILFDVGGVILTPLDGENAAAAQDEQAVRLGYADRYEMFGRFFAGPEWKQARVGEITEAEMWRIILPEHGLHTEEEQAAFLKSVFGVEGARPEIVSLIRSLHGRYQLGILSNASETLEEKLRQMGVYQFFDPVVNSYRIGAAKPDQRAFEIALSQLGAEPQQVYFIDDREGNTTAAAAMGFQCHLFIDVQALAADMRSRGLL